MPSYKINNKILFLIHPSSKHNIENMKLDKEQLLITFVLLLKLLFHHGDQENQS